MRRLPLIACALAVLVFAGCGGQSDEDAVRETVTEAVTSDDLSVCEENFTERYLKEAVGPGGIEQCKRLRKHQKGRIKGFRIDFVQVQGDRAAVGVLTETFGAERYALIKRDGRWRIDRAEGV